MIQNQFIRKTILNEDDLTAHNITNSMFDDIIVIKVFFFLLGIISTTVG